MGFRLLTEYHSFLFEKAVETPIFHKEYSFPSPYGVSFILIFNTYDVYDMELIKVFPSPYGVSFILMDIKPILSALDTIE